MWMLVLASGLHKVLYCKKGILMEHTAKIAMIKALRIGLHTKVQEIDGMIALLERGKGAPELTLAKRALQQSKHWAGEALGELGEHTHHILPTEKGVSS